MEENIYPIVKDENITSRLLSAKSFIFMRKVSLFCRDRSLFSALKKVIASWVLNINLVINRDMFNFSLKMVNAHTPIQVQ